MKDVSIILIDRETPLARTFLGQMSIVSIYSDVSTQSWVLINEKIIVQKTAGVFIHI